MPTEANRAAPWKPDPVLMYTGDDKGTSDMLAANLLPQPSATATNLLSMREYLTNWSEAGGGASGGASLSVPGEVLTMMGMTLGTSAKILAGVYVETAFVNEEVRGRDGGRGQVQATGGGRRDTGTAAVGMPPWMCAPWSNELARARVGQQKRSREGMHDEAQPGQRRRMQQDVQKQARTATGGSDGSASTDARPAPPHAHPAPSWRPCGPRAPARRWACPTRPT